MLPRRVSRKDPAPACSSPPTSGHVPGAISHACHPEDRQPEKAEEKHRPNTRLTSPIRHTCSAHTHEPSSSSSQPHLLGPVIIACVLAAEPMEVRKVDAAGTQIAWPRSLCSPALPGLSLCAALGKALRGTRPPSGHALPRTPPLLSDSAPVPSSACQES